MQSHGTQFRNCRLAQKARLGDKRSILAVAHKMLRAILAMLRGNQPYLDPDIDYQELVVHRNAPRWLRNLERYGYLEDLRAALAAGT